MARKNKVDIVKQLNALNPGVPTRTRAGWDISGDKPAAEPAGPLSAEPAQEGFSPGPFRAVELFFENLSAMGKLRNCMMQDALRFQGLLFDSWSKACGIVFDAMRANFDVAGAWTRRR
jgi:hypothetical protein